MKQPTGASVAVRSERRFEPLRQNVMPLGSLVGNDRFGGNPGAVLVALRTRLHQRKKEVASSHRRSHSHSYSWACTAPAWHSSGRHATSAPLKLERQPLRHETCIHGDGAALRLAAASDPAPSGPAPARRPVNRSPTVTTPSASSVPGSDGRDAVGRRGSEARQARPQRGFRRS